MSIVSQEQQDAVAALVRTSQVPPSLAVWIGLKRNKEGVISWVDGRPMEFEHWSKHEPDSAVEGDSEAFRRCAEAGVTYEDTRDNCGFLTENPDSLWWDGPCNVTSFPPKGDHERVDGLDGCYRARYPFICARPAIPGAACRIVLLHVSSDSLPLTGRSSLFADTASGGNMNGCLHGRWVLGRPHNNSALPSTVVRCYCPFSPLRCCVTLSPSRVAG